MILSNYYSIYSIVNYNCILNCLFSFFKLIFIFYYFLFGLNSRHVFICFKLLNWFDLLWVFILIKTFLSISYFKDLLFFIPANLLFQAQYCLLNCIQSLFIDLCSNLIFICLCLFYH